MKMKERKRTALCHASSVAVHYSTKYCTELLKLFASVDLQKKTKQILN
jgi:hypothetical protein